MNSTAKTSHGRERALTLTMAIISGVTVASTPAVTAFAANDATITTHGLRSTPQAGA
jgi:hypothetical protein